MKTIVFSIIIAVILIGGAFMVSIANPNSDGNASGANNTNNVSVVDGKQIVQINVKGGYRPEKSFAKAGVPTIIRFNTDNTFDCSSFIRISSLNISKALPQSGSTDIDVGSPSTGVLQGSCGMGMYRFEVEFN